ncbi:MAG: hypothetical protein GMKNLPBB_00547 [Myxococcota bacterium]|nr:hypothetical protein [Myxococcota bacterium]
MKTIRSLVIPVVAAAMLGCAAAKPIQQAEVPKDKASAAYSRFEFTERNYQVNKLDVFLKLTNPTGGQVDITGGEFTATLDGAPIKLDASRLRGSAAANGEAEVPVGLEIALPSESGELQRTLAKKTYSLTVQGTLQTSAGAMPITAQLDNMPYPELPQIKLAGSGIARDADNKYGITYELELVNPNDFDIRVAYYDYVIVIDNKEVEKGRLFKGEKVPANAAQYTAINSAITPESVGKDLFRKIITANNLPYTVGGTLVIADMEIAIAETGKLNFNRDSNQQ